MNERIRKLVEDANLRAFINKDGSLTPELHYFTESIVKECADFLKDKLDDHFAAEQLEEHFGVEE